MPCCRVSTPAPLPVLAQSPAQELPSLNPVAAQDAPASAASHVMAAHIYPEPGAPPVFELKEDFRT